MLSDEEVCTIRSVKGSSNFENTHPKSLSADRINTFDSPFPNEIDVASY